MTIAFKSSFLKAVQKLNDPKLKETIAEAIARVEAAEMLSDIQQLKKLSGYTVYFRLRVGQYRIGLKWENEEQTLYFVTFGHRKDIYKSFP